MPPRSAFPPNDARPLIGVLTEKLGEGELCRIVVDGWMAWDTCMRLRAKNADAACPVLDGILRQLEPQASPPTSLLS